MALPALLWPLTSTKFSVTAMFSLHLKAFCFLQGKAIYIGANYGRGPRLGKVNLVLVNVRIKQSCAIS